MFVFILNISEFYFLSDFLTPFQSYSWSGMYLMDPFSLAKSIVMLEIEGVSKLNPSKGHIFPLNTDESQSDAFETLQSRIEERNANADSKLVFVDLSSGVGGVSTYICTV